MICGRVPTTQSSFNARSPSRPMPVVLSACQRSRRRRSAEPAVPRADPEHPRPRRPRCRAGHVAQRVPAVEQHGQIAGTRTRRVPGTGVRPSARRSPGTARDCPSCHAARPDPGHILVREQRVVGPHLGAVECQPLDQGDGSRIGKLLDVLAVCQSEDENGRPLKRSKLALHGQDGQRPTCPSFTWRESAGRVSSGARLTRKCG